MPAKHISRDREGLRVLYVEESPGDADLVQRELQRGGFSASVTRVDTAERMAAALRERPWDVVIFDYAMRECGALQALQLLREHDLDTPFIIVSGTVGEETAVEAMKLGANNYLLKANLVRLVPIVERELREKEHRKARRESERTLVDFAGADRLLFDACPVPLFVFDVESLVMLAMNEAALRLYGYGHDEMSRLKVSDVEVAGSEAARARAALGDAKTAGVQRYRRRDGSLFVAEYTTRALWFAGRHVQLAAVRAIAHHDKGEQAGSLLASITQTSNDAIISKLPDGTITSWNSAATSLFGYLPEEAIGKPITLIVPPERLDEERVLMTRLMAGESVSRYETVRLRKDGTEVIVSISLAPILDAAGAITGASKTARDLSEERRAAQTLRRTENQLRHSQKMEVVGRLAGGIAHDFNNVLSVILGYSEMILGDLKPSEPIAVEVDEIRKAAVRAADLTRQLLAFGRRQVLEPRVVDLNLLLSGMNTMLKRIVGEDIDLAFAPSPRLGRIRANPSHVEQVIMNLVVNARDAMPTGGKLTIETGNVEFDDDYVREHLGFVSGANVMLAVSDTGSGMEPATQARIFEPFFTTKEVGKGTGLGLSTVLAIVQQCGGNVWVYSEPGTGTSFKVYFPLADGPVDAPAPSQPLVSVHGSETILLVEDNRQVRNVAEGILKRHGYRVIAAQSPADAVLLFEQHAGEIELLLTDVVMPGMSGTELAKRLIARQPEMKVLFMSGYTDDSVVRHGVIENRVAFLQKPFTRESLTRRVREVLGVAPKGGR